MPVESTTVRGWSPSSCALILPVSFPPLAAESLRATKKDGRRRVVSNSREEKKKQGKKDSHFSGRNYLKYYAFVRSTKEV